MWLTMDLTFCIKFLLFWNLVKGQNYDTCHFTTGAGSVICDCSSLGLTEITEPLRADITVLILRNNSLQTISAEIFRNNNQLIELDLSQNRLTSIRENTFSNLRSLLSLNISANGIMSLDSSSLRNLQQLRVLALHDNRLSVMPYLNDLHNLQDLQLHGNSFQDIISTDFQGLRNLRYLDISRNQIHTIAVQVFENMNDLVHLNLSHNEIRELYPSTFHRQVNLEDLDLAYNPMGTFNLSIFNTLTNPRISRLNLTDNNLNYLPSELFTRLPTITHLQVANNNIEVWRRSFFRDAGVLEVLNLAGNGIALLEKSMFSRQPKLRILDLSRNRVENVEQTLLGIPNLEILDLSFNHIRVLPTDLLSSPLQLRRIGLSGNLLNSTPAFTEYLNLEVIKLNANSIYGVLDGDFYQLRMLSELDLSNNYIQQVQVNAFAQARSLIFINLQANKLSTLPVRLFTNLQQLMTLDLRRNPWQCDCDLFDFLQSVPNKVELIPDVTCQTPPSLLGQSIQTALYCDDQSVGRSEQRNETGVVAVSVIIAIVGCIVFAILVFRYLARRKDKDKKYSVEPTHSSPAQHSPSNFARTLPMPPNSYDIHEGQNAEIPYYLSISTLRSEVANQYSTIDGRRPNPDIVLNGPENTPTDGYLTPTALQTPHYAPMANLYLKPKIPQEDISTVKKPMPDIEGNYLSQIF